MNDFYPPRGPGTPPPTFPQRHQPPTSPPSASSSPPSDAPPAPPPPPLQADPNEPPQFPNASPRVWFLAGADAPIPLACAQQLIAHGDAVVAGVDLEADASSGAQASTCRDALSELGPRCVLVDLDARSNASVQAALARGISAFGHIDILFVATTRVLVGTVEELATADALVAECFRTNCFGVINVVAGVLPHMRARGGGHVVLLTGITGHLGTPGLGAYCASQWAVEGYCDSLAYEVAPFGIRVSIVQSNIEVVLLTSRVASAPAMSAYGTGSWTCEGDDEIESEVAAAPRTNRAPLARGWLSSLLQRLETAAGAASNSRTLLSGRARADFEPVLPAGVGEALIAETVYALLSIGGHENPPARHIVGLEGVASVKEKLKTVSEELEDFVAVSSRVDL